jgi:hypothetical protein
MKIVEMIEVLKHFWDGGKVERFIDSIEGWREDKDPLWDFYSCNYRKTPEPEYVPFDITDAAEIVGRKLHKWGGIYSIDLSGVNTNYGYIPFDSLLESYKFADGSRCGKLKQP